MGVEVGKSDGFEVAPAPFESVAEQNGKLDQGKGHTKVSIKFGSHDEPSKGEENNSLFSSDAPKDAVEEWPAVKEVRTFFFVRHRTYDDPKIKAKLDQTDKELQKLNRARAGIVEELKAKRAERSELFSQLMPLKSKRDGFNSIFDEKKKEMEPLQQALGKLRSNDSGARGFGLCSSEEELNDLIYSLQYRIQHESIPLNEEKQLLKEIKQLEGTREKVIANAVMKEKIKDSIGQKGDLRDQVKLMGVDLDGVKKERQAVGVKIKQVSEKIVAVKEDIESLETELKIVTEKRDKTFANIQDLRKQRDETNANFYQSRGVLTKARDLAANKNTKDLEALAHAEIEKFMSFWNSKKNFRDDYEKRVLPSLDARQLSRDGRIRNPEEKPLIAPEVPSKTMPSSETEVLPKARAKQVKEDLGSASKSETSVSHNTQKEASNKVKDTKPTSDRGDDDEVIGLGKPQKEEKKVIDEATLKEIKRQEELAKAKQAMERKKKLAEKAAAKAAIRAQKEAEKKEKEREKRAKKKAGFTNSASEPEAPAEEVAEASEPEKNEVEAPVQEKGKPEKEKVLREKPVRNRGPRTRGSETLPRAVLKRKKSNNYWVWAGPAAAVAALVLLALVYYYFL